MTNEFAPVIDSTWVLAMICCGGIGFLFHILFVSQTFLHYRATTIQSSKASVFLCGSLLMFCFNMFACLIWAVLRTNIMIPLSLTACKAIYTLNFLCYFVSKYILHCLLIFRIYMTFTGDKLTYMSRKTLILIVSMVSVNFFIAIGVWIYSIVPSVLQGEWMVNDTHFAICTLFSSQVDNHLSVKISAITIGIEDFIVGTVTLFVFLKRFRKIAFQSQDADMLESSTRFGVVAFFSVVSTLFLFTLAIPLYPNATFILAVDATINSLCLFCVLSVGKGLYYYVCAPCRVCGNGCTNKSEGSLSSASQIIGYFIHSSGTPPKEAKKDKKTVVVTTNNGNAAIIAPCDIETPQTPLTSHAPQFPQVLTMNIQNASPTDGSNGAGTDAIAKCDGKKLKLSLKTPASVPVCDVKPKLMAPSLENKWKSDPFPLPAAAKSKKRFNIIVEGVELLL